MRLRRSVGARGRDLLRSKESLYIYIYINQCFCLFFFYDRILFFCQLILKGFPLL